MSRQIPSLDNPPNAPRKRHTVSRFNVETEKDEEVSWRWLAERGVRAKFLRYNPEDIDEIDDMDTLLVLKNFYSPSSQPYNIYEHSYCVLIRDAVERKMYML